MDGSGTRLGVVVVRGIVRYVDGLVLEYLESTYMVVSSCVLDTVR